jgi:hypothetical protein
MLKTQANSRSLLVIKEAVLNLRYFSRTYITLMLVAFFSTSLASEPSDSYETPSIKQAQEKLMQQIKNQLSAHTALGKSLWMA